MPFTMKNKTQANDLWLRAAVVGGLWASIEIIIGSFLHNTRLPFAGSILAFAGTVLLIGFYQIWPYKGLIIRAGLITAIMKSVSPSAIILGPMTGILLEAILIELMLNLAGKNLFSFMVAGILSISSALFHKIISIIIFYGFNLVKIYVNIINFGLKQMGFQPASELQILLFLLVFYFGFGMLAGWLGALIGKKAQALRSNLKTEFSHDPSAQSEFFTIDKNQKTSIPLLIFHILSVPAGLFLINFHFEMAGYLFIASYILAIGFNYRKALRRLRKPVFWSQLIVIVILSALFWNFGKADHQWFSREGFVIGFEMLIRALFIVVAFSAISVELLNEHVRHFLVQIGFGQFYKSLGMAFGALPIMISLLPKTKEIIRTPIQSLLKPLVMADQWLAVFKKEK
jgi:hypothetical protein